MSCPSDQALARYVRLGEDEGATADDLGLRHHVLGCASCRTRIGSFETSGPDPRHSSDSSVAHDATAGPGDRDAAMPSSGERRPAGDWRLEVGSRIDHFTIVRGLGRGATSEVYLARDMKLSRKVALKLLVGRRLRNPVEIEQALFEAQATAAFSHPNIVSIYSVGVFGGRLYFALEYLEGQSLRARLEAERLSLREAIRVAHAVAKALREAHGKDILHRDLKPGNIIVGEDGRVRVVDFGLAVVASKPPSSKAGLSSDAFIHESQTKGIGTPAYMSPEQWQGAAITGASDVWALGVILYELLAGKRPFSGQQPGEQEQLVCDGELLAEPLDVDALDEGLARLVGQALAKTPEQRPSIAVLEEALGDAVRSFRARERIGGSPFRGLLPFSEDHANSYYGRDREIAALVERIRDHPILPVIGPSGVGKSSLLQAGVVPRLRDATNWRVVKLHPGNQPLSALATALARDVKADPVLAERIRERPAELGQALREFAVREHCRVLLLVDQLEELFTLRSGDDELARRFMQAVCGAADDVHEPVRVVLTLRDDFLAHLARIPEAQEALRQVTVLARPDSQMLRQTLREPLSRLGYGFDDPALIDEMVEAVVGEDASLPLLQFVASKLWDERDREARVLTRASYEEMGGVEGALARHADGVLEQLAPRALSIARRVLVRLVTSEGTRTVISRRELVGELGGGAGEVLQALTDARLVTARRSGAEPSDAEHSGAEDGEDTRLELAHESLVSTWATLARWLEESRGDVAFLAEVGAAAKLWDRRGRLEMEVWEGEALADAERKLARCGDNVPKLVVAFIGASRVSRQRAKRRRQIQLVAVAASLAVVTVVSLVIAAEFREREREAQRSAVVAREQQVLAQRQKRVADAKRAEALRESAAGAYARDDLLGARAKLRNALEIADSVEARALWDQLSKHGLVWRYDAGAFVQAMVFSPDGSWLAVAPQNRSVRLIDTRSAQLIRVLRGFDVHVSALAVSVDGKLLAAGTKSGAIRLCRLDSLACQPLHGHEGSRLRALAFDGAGRRLAVGSWSGDVSIWELAPGAAPRRLLRRDYHDSIYALAWHPRGDQLAVGSTRGAFVVKPEDGERVVDAFAYKVGPSKVRYAVSNWGLIWGLRYAPDGAHLVSAGEDGTVRIWPTTSGQEPTVLRSGAVLALDLSADGNTVVYGGEAGGVLHVYDRKRGRSRAIPLGDRDIRSLALHPSGRYVAAADAGHRVRLWDLTVDQTRAGIGQPLGPMEEVAFLESSTKMATCARGGDAYVRLWDAASGRQLNLIKASELADGSFDLAVSPDSRSVAVSGDFPGVAIWDLEKGLLRTIPVGSGASGKLVFSSSQQLLTSHGDTVAAWQVGTGALLWRHSIAGMLTMASSPGAPWLAASSGNGKLVVWDIASRRIVSQALPFDTMVDTRTALAMSRDGEQIVFGAPDGSVSVWSSSPLRRTARFHHGGLVLGVAVAPDGKAVASAGADRRAVIWPLDGRKPIVLAEHHDEVNAVTFSHDGSRVGTAADDSTVRIWDARSGEPLFKTVALLLDPPAVLTHQGWSKLGDRALPPTSGWRERLEREGRWAAMSPDRTKLCLQTVAGGVELWALSGSKRLAAGSAPKARRLVALNGGCAWILDGELRSLTTAGRVKILTKGVSAFGHDGAQGMLVARGDGVAKLAMDGSVLKQWRAEPGAVAVGRAHGQVVLGYIDGTLAIAAGPGPATTTVRLQPTPRAAVVALHEGPMNTLVAGFANGVLGLWSLSSGRQIDAVYLHGPVRHIVADATDVYAASELGNHARWSLQVFHKSYCEVLRSVWERVPVAWGKGGVSVTPRPRQHRCAL